MRKTPNNTVRVAAAGAQLLNKKAIDAFCKNNQDFDLQQFNFFNPKAVAALHWGEADQATLLPQLKAMQRLVRLTNNLETAETLYKRGLHAAVQIASMPAHKFVAQYKDVFIPNSLSAEAQAQQVHQKALARKSQAVLTYTAIAQHNAHHYRATRFDNLSAATASSFDGVPSYQELFGDLDFCDCPDCRSIFSPAAYFVDLMRLQDHYITGTKELHQLKTRRPDLWTTELSCDNTNTQVSKLEIVNKVLINAWKNLDNTASYEKLATTDYPFNLPFNLPLTQIRQYLRQNKQTLPQLWQSLLTPIDEAAQQAIDREILPLAPKQWELYSSPTDDKKMLCSYYGVSGDDPVSALTAVKDFLAQTGLRQVQLNELLAEDLSEAEIKQGLNANFFININTEKKDIAPISIDETQNTLTNLTVARLDHINRFVRLAQALGWSFTDLDWALNTIAQVLPDKDTPGKHPLVIKDDILHYLAWLQTLQQQEPKCSINQACALIGTVKDFGKKEGPTFFEQIFNNPNVPNPPQWKNEQGEYSLVWDLSKPDSDSTLQIQSALTAALKVSLDDLLEMASQLLSALDITDNKLPLTLANLSILYRLSQLPALTGLAIDECFVALALPGFSPDALKQLAGNDLQAAQKQLVALTDFAQWIKTTNFSVYQLQYILTGKSAQATIQNQLLGTTAITNFTKSTQKAIKATLLTQQQFSTAVQPLLQPSEYSPEAAKVVYKALQQAGGIGQDGKVLKIPDAPTMQKITLQVYPAGTKAAENPYVASLSQAFIALLTKYNQKILGEDAFVKETASSFLHFLRADNLVTQLWKALQVTDEQPWYIDPHGVITKEATNEQVKERVKPVLFPQIPSSALENIVTLVTNTLNSALQLQHETLTRHLGSLYGLSSALVFALEIWGHLTVGNFEEAPMVQQGQEDTDAATLLLQALLAATSSTIPENSKIGQYLQKMQPYAQLLKSLALSAAETQALVDHPGYFGVGYQKANSSAAQPQFTITNIQTLDQFKKLVQSLQDTQNRLLEYFQLAATTTDRATIVQKLHQLTQWDQGQLQFLFDELWSAAANTIPGYATVKGVAQLQAYFTTTQQLNLAIQSTWRLKALHATTAYGDFQNAAHTLWAGLQKQYQDQPATLTTIQNALNANKRDALLRLMMHQLRTQKGLPITTTRDLYEYLLIDVAVMGEVKTSYVKEAIAAVQLYIYRCRNHLEPGVTVAKELDTWWSWLEHYRVWQANREVFLYPENYIQPELRKEKSEQFVQLEQALQQSSLKETNVDTAVKTYLDGFATVANLQVVGSYLYASQTANDAPHAQQNLYLVGRTSTQPYTYYYRTGTFNKYNDSNTYTATQWSPWVKINVQINSTLATPVFAFDRLFLFWVETKQGKSDRKDKESEAKKRFEATLYYSYYDFNKQWVASQQLGDVIPLPPDVDTADKAAQPEWQQLKAIFVPSDKAIYWAYNGHQGILTAQLQAIAMTSMVTGDSVTTPNTIFVFKILEDSGTLWYEVFSQTMSSPEGAEDFGGAVALWGSQCVVGNIKPDSKALKKLVRAIPELAGQAREHLLAACMDEDNSKEVYVYKLESDGKWPEKPTQTIRSPDRAQIFGWSIALSDSWAIVGDSGKVYLYKLGADGTWPEKSTQTIIGPKGINVYGHSVALWGSWAAVGNFLYQQVYIYKLGADGTWPEEPTQTITGDISFGYSIALSDSWAIVSGSLKVYLYKLESDGKWPENPTQTIKGPEGASDFGYFVAFWGSWCVVGGINTSNLYVYKLGDDGKWPEKPTYQVINFVPIFGKSMALWRSYTDILRHDRIPTLNLQLDWSIVTGPDKSTQFLAIPGPTGQPSYIRLNDTVVQQLSSLLFGEGMEGLLALHTQYTPEVNMDGSQTPTLDFAGANGLYYWELFFHMPFLVAHSLSTQQQFEQAKQWYDYIFNPTIQDSALQAFWPMDEGAGSRIQDQAQDHQGNLHGTPDWTKAAMPLGSRTVLHFDGTTNYINAPYDDSLNRDIFTISCWVKITGGQGNRSLITACHDGKVSGYGLGITQDDRYLFWLGNSKNYTEVKGPQVILNTWTHLIASYDGSQATLYVDGTPYSASLTEFIPNQEHPLYIGAGSTDADTPKNFFHGQITAVRIWDEALSVAQVLARDYATPNDKYWQFLQLRSQYNPTLQHELGESWAKEMQEDLGNTMQLAAYHNDPFDPHAIARLRPIAYQKTLVMHYIDNLLNWADKLYRQNTMETIEEATMLYIMAYDLLGHPPASTGPCPLPTPEPLADILTHYDKDLSKIPEFLIDVEQQQGVHVVSTVKDTPHNYIPGLYFGLPDNAQFMGYWDKVRQRLYNIRHSLTIDGQVDHLALFEAPINPMQLVAATSSGEAVAEATSIGQALLPHYRFGVMVAKAQAMVQTVIQLGQAFLSALEKKDAEQLTLLYNTQQQDLLALTRVSKQDQLEAATQSRNAMQASLQNAQDRSNHYTTLISQGLSSGEVAHMTLEGVSMGLQTAAQAIKLGSIAGYALPNIFGFSDGGMHFGDVISQGAYALEGSAQATSMAGGLAATMAGYQRRAEDWQLQQTLAQDDVQQIQYQILAAQYQQAFAQQEIVQLEKQVSQLQAVEDFLKNKFTSQQLYQWTLGQLSTLYFQAYQLAYTMAQQAEQAWQFERGKQQTFTHPGHWNELYHGLVAGEALQLDLQRMEKAYMDQNERKLEIEKVISLNQLSPQALLALKSKGSCIIELIEKDFDFDYPGHYFRQIKTISLSFPSLLGPYQNIHATLTQTSNRTLLQADTAGVQYLLGVTKEQPDNSILRVDARVYQQVALSQGLNDSGLFELNFNDERYLPFEGTGAISSWQLDMPKEDNALHFDSLADVVIRLRYTAFSGGKAFQDAVKQARGAFQSHRSVMVAQEFASAWYGFTHNKTPLALTISPSLFRPNFSTYHLTDVTLMLVLTDQGKQQGWKDTQLTLQPSGKKLTLGGDPSTGIVAATEKISVEVTPQGLPWNIKASSYELITEENISDMVIVLGYTAKS